MALWRCHRYDSTRTYHGDRIMKTKKVIQRVERALGVEIVKRGGHYYFEYGDRIGSFICNGGPEGHASCFRIRRKDDHDDIMTDYFAGHFVGNCKQFIETFKPPEPKYELGELVQGKTTKRAKRQGIAGKIGLVLYCDSYYVGVKWAGSGLRERVNVRDIGKVPQK